LQGLGSACGNFSTGATRGQPALADKEIFGGQNSDIAWDHVSADKLMMSPGNEVAKGDLLRLAIPHYSGVTVIIA